MKSKITIPATDVARDFANITNRVRYGGETITVQRHGKDVCVIAPLPEPETHRTSGEDGNSGNKKCNESRE